MRRFNTSESPVKGDTGKNSDGLWLQNPRARFPKRDCGSTPSCGGEAVSNRTGTSTCCHYLTISDDMWAASATTAPRGKVQTQMQNRLEKCLRLIQKTKGLPIKCIAAPH